VDRATTATLLVCCPDRKGLVAALAQVLYGHGANILDADQHTDPVAGEFFQRIHFDAGELQTDAQTLERAIAEVAERFEMTYRLARGDVVKRVAIFVSAEQFGLVFHEFPIDKKNKLEQERLELELLQSHRIDLVVLARYMQILSDGFIEAFPARIINIHHSFLPAFVGSQPYQRAYERGVKLIGATAHYATAELDEGPIIEQEVMRTSHRDSVEDLLRKGRDAEKLALARAVRWHLEDRVLVYGNKTVVFS
jgi:formyltetrahydrofolate deformylase